MEDPSRLHALGYPACRSVWIVSIGWLSIGETSRFHAI
jgi:hypothetical protein